MAEDSKIEWTDHTFNPWIGCTKVSAGCAHCYAENLMDTRYGRVKWGRGNPRQRTSESNWKMPLRWNREAEKSGMRARVFCASLADWLDPEVPIEWLADLLDLIRRTPYLDWLLLTKRPELWRNRMAQIAISFPDWKGEIPPPNVHDWCCDWYRGSPPQNVWIGTSVEDQLCAQDRIPDLWEIPAAVRFLSCEPLLGPVNLETWLFDHGDKGPAEMIHWVIVGGESGKAARPMEREWVDSLRQQCDAAQISFFFKQWGGRDKKAAGRLLDGRTWDAVPSQNVKAQGMDALADIPCRYLLEVRCDAGLV